VVLAATAAAAAPAVVVAPPVPAAVVAQGSPLSTTLSCSSAAVTTNTSNHSMVSSSQNSRVRRGKRDKQPAATTAMESSLVSFSSSTTKDDDNDNHFNHDDNHNRDRYTSMPPLPPMIRARLDTIQSVGTKSPDNSEMLFCTPASRKSCSENTFFSDPRIPLDDDRHLNDSPTTDAYTTIAPMLPTIESMKAGNSNSGNAQSADSASNLVSTNLFGGGGTTSSNINRRTTRTPHRSGAANNTTNNTPSAAAATASTSTGTKPKSTNPFAHSVLPPRNTPLKASSFAQVSRESFWDPSTPAQIGSAGTANANANPNVNVNVNANAAIGTTGKSSLAAVSVANDSATTGVATYSSTIVPDLPSTPCPRLQLRVGVDEVQVVFTTRHYELLNYLFSTIARMNNGRPDRTIRSVKETEPGSEIKALLKMHNPKNLKRFLSRESDYASARETASSAGGSYTGQDHLEQANTNTAATTAPASGGIISYFWPSSSYESAAADTNNNNNDNNNDGTMDQFFSPLKSNSEPYHAEDDNLSNDGIPFYQGKRLKSARQEVVAQWWKYAIGAIKWEIRKRKHTASVFRDMYISFDWGKQRYRRREYIDLYIANKLNKNSKSGLGTESVMGSTSAFYAKKRRKAEEKLTEIEDDLPIEQILLYRSIARSMKVRGTSQMPSTVYELWGKEGLTSAKIARRSARSNRVSFDTAEPNKSGVNFGGIGLSTPDKDSSKVHKNINTSFLSHDYSLGDFDDDEDGDPSSTCSGLLAMVQKKFDSAQRLREEGGVQAYFAAQDGSDDTAANAGHEAHEFYASNNDSNIAMNGFDFTTPKRASEQEGGIKSGRFYSVRGAKKDFSTIGDIQQGRTIRSHRTKRLFRGSTSGSDTKAMKPVADNRMRLFFSFQIKKFNLIVVEEENCVFDVSPGEGGINRYLDSEDSSGRDKASVLGDLSDLSVLTDDQRFFSGDDNDGQSGVIVEEEEAFDDSGKPKMRSTDFLCFNQPENLLLRLSISSLVTTSKGISGGDMEFGVSISRIEAAGDQDTHILSMGLSDPSLPLEEVNIRGPGGPSITRRLSSGTDASSVDLSTYVSGKHRMVADGMYFTRSPSSPPRQAISLKFSKEGPSKILQCDLSKIAISSNIESAEKLVRFYSRPDVKQPEKLLTKTSRDVARKIMVKKMSNTSTTSFSNITSAIRIHGIEVRIPFSFDQESDSELDSSYQFSHNLDESVGKRQPHNYSTILEAGILELYSGNAVNELVQSAVVMSEGKDRSVASGSLPTHRSQTVIGTLEMLDIAELTRAHDSFASNHFVLTARGITCGFESDSAFVPNLMGLPLNVEVLMTSNGASLLDTESPKLQTVVEISPVNIVLSERRLDLLAATKSALDFGKLNTNAVTKKRFNPDPPRIEILSKRILSSLDLTCSHLRIELVKDNQVGELGPPKIKELVMEETLSDFLSIVACFEFTLPDEEELSPAMQACIERPNEEALSSAMQVCIGRLRGLGLNDKEAWACTNSARLNFLNDITLIRKTESLVFAEMSENIAKQRTEEKKNGSALLESFVTESDGSVANRSSDEFSEFSDDDSKNSAQMVETTINSAVEKTVVSFSTLLQSFLEDESNLNDSAFLFLDLPMGLSLSMINLFYDQHVKCLLPSLVATNKAGVELLTLVPSAKNGPIGSVEEKALALLAPGILFSRFNLDTNNGFGKGGLPMSVLASDKGAESDLAFRERSRFDDIELGECEFFFSSSIFEEIIDEMNELLPKKIDDADSVPKDNTPNSDDDDSLRPIPLTVRTSTVLMASSLSLLFTSETLVPFCRLTLENACVKNGKAMKSLNISDASTFALVAKFFSLQNLSPEGQFFPDILQSIPLNTSSVFPIQIRFFRSPDPWKIGNHLEVEFTSFRFFLVRQFVNDLLHYFVYDKYGVGKLKKKYEKNIVDIHGNIKPPLLYSVYIHDTSMICPRNSASNDMVAFEVEEACIEVSYIPKSFAMPTKSSPFCANPTNENQDECSDDNDFTSRSNSFGSLSDYVDCESFMSTEKVGPISSHTSDLKRRLTISLDRIRAFTAIAGDKTTQENINSSLFRFFYTIDGRAEDSKAVYKEEPSRRKYLNEERRLDFEQCIQSWEEISTNPFSLEILFDSAPHTRLLISCKDCSSPLSLDARLSQLCLLLSVWDSNMQELGTMCPLSTDEVFAYASPPTIPDDFPEYSSEEFVSYLETIKSIGSEICCIFKKLTIRCTFDKPGYFPKDPDCFQYFEDPDCADEVKPGLILTLEDMVVHVLSNHLNIKRIGIGSSSIDIIDERRVPSFQSVLSSDPIVKQFENSNQPISWADLSWGLREDVRTLGTSLPQPMQCSVFMTPGWSMTNLGIQSPNGAMHDLSWIWVLLGYFKSYYSDSAFGNPGFESQKWSHIIKNALRRSASKDTLQFVPQPGLNIDFRVWLCQPTLCLPSDYFESRAPSLVLSSETGFWYRYKSIKNFASQEVVSTDLNLSFANEFLPPEKYRHEAYVRASRTTGSIRSMIEGLSFGLRYDSNSNQCNHKDISVAIPFSGEKIPSLSVVGQELEVEPIKLDPPRVLKPFNPPTRHFGSKVCNITCIIEVLPLATATLMNFFCGPLAVNVTFAPTYDTEPPKTFSVTAKLRDIKMFLIDPDLGVQLPIAVLSLSSSTLSVSKFAIEPITEGLAQGESQPSDMQIILATNLWIDYFKLGLTRSWEPLLEPFEFQILHETSSERGQGYSFNSDGPLHFNLSSALLSFLSEVTESLSTVIRETFGDREDRACAMGGKEFIGPSSEVEGGARLEDITKRTNGHDMSIIHEVPKSLKGEDKVAFSLRNLTGQRIRIHQQSNFSDGVEDKPVVVTYLNQGESAGLTFAATISVVKNLRIVEVPYPGFEVSKNNKEEKQGSLHHAIDLQIPGCRWIQGVRLDTFGRKFQSLTPRSSQVFEKISNDWRLRNAMTVLTEVGPDNGGRLLSVRSIFQIKNNTTHAVKLNFHPDPKYKPDVAVQDTKTDHNDKEDSESLAIVTDEQRSPSECFVIEPDCNFQLPTLLVESSLEMDGSHLGSVWLRPDTSHTETFSFRDFSKPTKSKIEDFDASFCSRPVQLAKIVHETSLIYNSGGGGDIEQCDATSGVQVSCPTHSQSGNIRTPFCYAIEICRSPIVKSNIDADKPFLKSKKKGKSRHPNLIHGPVAYTLVIHSPIVIVNLLPEGGRFELMHAIRKTVVWYADLKPGQQILVHSLGLDAPLLLLVNLGFCRTPVGEGALVHHGGNSVEYSKEQSAGLKSFGKAVSKNTKKIGQKLTNLADTPDKRAQERVSKMFTPKSEDKRRKKGNVKHERPSIDGRSLGLDLGETGTNGVRGKVHAIEAVTYSAEDIADETTVVDSIGQRLRLRIENIRGGGGQRRISLYCPYWIVNTTEHALRYKEDKEKRYVSGTVLSPEKNASMPVDGSNRHYRSRYEMQSKRRTVRSSRSQDRNAQLLNNIYPHLMDDSVPMNKETVFAGTHGALATFPGQCTLSPEDISVLIDEDMPLKELAEIAFMFNFFEESLGVDKLIVQLYDGLQSNKSKNLGYDSGWSAGFALETVGFSQVIGLPCKDGRMLELSATVNVAPGFLSGYTKIVRFCPRYAVYNRLDRPIRLWQDSSIIRSLAEDRSDATNSLEDQRDSRKWRYDFEDEHYTERIGQYELLFGRYATLDDRSSINGDESQLTLPEGTAAHRSALYIANVGPSQLAPFFLPDTRCDSQLRIDLGGPWNLTSSFASNVPGEHVLDVSRATNIRLLNHVSIRDAPKYKIILPPPKDTGVKNWDGELGAYFETEWAHKGDRKIIVRGTKRGKYASNHTDMRVGDELLRINGISVSKMTFEEAMKIIKDKLGEIREYQEKGKVKQGGRIIKNTKGVLKRFSISKKQTTIGDGGITANRVLRHLTLGGKKRDTSQVDQEIVEPTPLTMTFRTQEERLRKIRIKAISRNSAFSHAANTMGDFDPESLGIEPIDTLTVETKAIHNTMFIILRNTDKENPPFKIQNRSLKYHLFYRQRNCEEHAWNILMPGESRSYSWEEPMKSKKLTVRIAVDPHEPPKEGYNNEKSIDSLSDGIDHNFEYELEPEENVSAVRADRLRQLLAYQYVHNEERGGFGLPTTVRLEEIGSHAFLPVPTFVEGLDQKIKYLYCEVDTDGGTRLLVISDLCGEQDERETMHRNIENLQKQRANEVKRSSALQSMRHALLQPIQRSENENLDFCTEETAKEELANMIENELKELVEEFPEGNSVTKRCQVVVQVLEGVGLSLSNFVGTCNPYCEVFYKGRSRSRKHFLQKRMNKRKTYFIEKNSNPKWNDQYFVFDVPEEAINVTRGHSIRIVVRDFRVIGQHPILGQASMHFASIRNQQELVGWWPLVGRHAGSTEVSMERESDSSRGSIKLRVQWIYTLPAMIDYYSLMSERRLETLIKTEKGMQEQLKSANESFQKRREAKDRHPGRRIAKFVKLQKKNFANIEPPSMKRELMNKERQNRTNQTSPLNTNFLHLKKTLKSSRKRSLKVLSVKTVESRRKRRLESDEVDNDANFNNYIQALKTRRRSRPTLTPNQSAGNDYVGKLKRSSPPVNRNRTKSLGDFFAEQRSSTVRSRRGTTDWKTAQQLSKGWGLDLDGSSVIDSAIVNNNTHQQSLMGRHQDQESDLEISDFLSVSTDAQENYRRKNDIARLHALRFVFHESGEFFHEDHLQNHFRRLLFTSSIEQRKSQLLYRRRHFVGTSSFVKRFKNWQAAQTLLWDSELKVVKTEKGFILGLNHKVITSSSSKEPKYMMNTSKSVISKNLSVPNQAPRVTIERSKYRIETMNLSRNQFDRSCRRILGCVLNPGGWLTIRPIAAMNLPGSYTGMYVKVIHGSEVKISETVDGQVAPKWSSTRLPHTSKLKGRKRSSIAQPPNTIAAADFEFSENDFHLQVEPQQTGGSIRLSVVAERHKTKVELGVVHIPLGAAIAACIDTAQSIEMSGCSMNNEIPLYSRWFPLIEPQLAVPVAGDMGLCTRPEEYEQLSDNMFQQYFAPCIHLSLMWWPYDQNQTENENQVGAKKGITTSFEAYASVISRITRIPAIKAYFNSDINFLSVALIDSVRAVELLNLSLREIDVKYAITRAKTRIGLVVGWIQLDQQDDNSREPVVFAPTPSEYPQPTLQFLALKDNFRTKTNIVSYEYVGVALQEMDLTVEEPRIFELWDFFMAVLSRKRMKIRAVRGQQHADVISRKKNIFTSTKHDDVSKSSLFEIIQSVGDRGARSQKQKMYVEQLILGLVKINLSYVKGKKQNFELSEKGVYDVRDFTMVTGGGHGNGSDPKKNDQSEIFMKWSQLTSDQDSALDSAGAHNLPGIIAAVFPSVSDAPIRLQGKIVEHVFESPVEILSSLKNYYTNETLKQVYKIIGSLDFVGNPTILLSSFMSGVKDLVSAPTAAFMKSPANVKQVGIGVGKGTVSFLSHSASGFFGFTARLFSQVGQGMAFFSLDSDYRQWHRERVVNEAKNLERVWKRRGMPKVEEIVLRPIADVFLGVTLGVSGVVFAPYRGAQKAGTRGFFVGTGVGIAGLVTKPIVGVFDAFMHGSQSIHDIAKTINFLERRYQPVLKLRLPYVFGPMKILSPFGANCARSVYLLGLFPPKTKLKHRRDKGHELHIHSEVLQMEPGVETYAIVTTIRIVLIKVKRDSTKATTSLSPLFGWEVDMSTGATISSEVSDHGHNGVALTITKCDDGPPPKIGKKENKTFADRSRCDGYEECEEVGELGEDFQTPQLDSISLNSSTPTKPLSETVASGIKQRGSKYLEWFAVLAEYQQRKQLNRIHNAISCIVGDHDEVISDRNKKTRGSVINDVAGTTSFGIYNFEKGLPDGRAAQISNMKVIASLEDLYWMEDDLVQRISNISSPSRRRKALTKVLETWNFSNDMMISKNMSGPKWLIRARAKAMSVASDNIELVDDTDTVPLSSRTMHALFAGYNFDHEMTSSTRRKITSETLDQKLQCAPRPPTHERADPSNVSLVENKGESRSVLDSSDVSKHSNHIDVEEQSSSGSGASASGKVNSMDSNNSVILTANREILKATPIPGNESEKVYDSPGALGLPMGSLELSNESVNYYESSIQDTGTDSGTPGELEFYSPINGVMRSDGQIELHGTSNSSHVHQPPPVPSLHVPQENSSISDLEQLVSKDSVSQTRNNLPSSTTDNGLSRIDRLEGILTQLVILNAAQARREEITARESLDSRSQLTNGSDVLSFADNLRQELGEIREKMEVRAREDETLRQEISLLRDQLADRRTTTGNVNHAARGEFEQQRPPPINTSLSPNKKKTRKKIHIRGIFPARNKTKKPSPQTQQQQQHEELQGSEEYIAYTPEPPLGFDYEQNGSCSM